MSPIFSHKTLILPNIAALSNAQCDQLRSYLRRGGSLVATFETSLYDEWGVRREDFGLADILGVRYKGRTDGPMQNSYLRIEENPVTHQHHPLLAGLEDAGRIINGVYRVDVESRERMLNAPLTLIPSYPDLPMEEVYPRQLPAAGRPGVVEDQAGAEFGDLPGRAASERLAPDVRDTAASATSPRRIRLRY